MAKRAPVVYGARGAAVRRGKGARELWHTRFVKKVESLRDLLEVEPLGEAVATSYARVRCQLEGAGVKIGDRDTLIAAHALALGAVLVTRNVREFSHVEGLVVENCDAEDANGARAVSNARWNHVLTIHERNEAGEMGKRGEMAHGLERSDSRPHTDYTEEVGPASSRRLLRTDGGLSSLLCDDAGEGREKCGWGAARSAVIAA